jgi:hypothetical protein
VASENCILATWLRIVCLLFSVEDMIKEVDVDGDGRIDFYGKEQKLQYI